MQGLSLIAAAPAVLIAAPAPAGPARFDLGQPLAETTPRAVSDRVVWDVPVLHTLGLFTTMRATEAVLWPTPFADLNPNSWLKGYERAFSRPPVFDPYQHPFEWDGDHWTINLLGHGLLGAELYYRPRRCGASVLEAFAFAASASAVWEYAFEGNAVRPSALDLAFTPLSGLLLGEARQIGWSAAGGIGNRTWRGIVRAILDPLGEIERGIGTSC